ncbi:MAG TPA: hypothetical protein VN034_08375 [Sphingopyxis sp.]|nr:hypothetical protein [Sphingopyxis sp.]
MSKFALVIFLINFVLLLISIALMMPIPIWQWILLVGSGSWCIRSWLAARREEEALENSYGGKNILPKKGGAPTYHDL